MFIDVLGNVWISDNGELAGLLVLVLGLFSMAHLSISRDCKSDASCERLGEHLVHAKMLTYGNLHTKPLRFSTGLRLDTTGQYARVEKVMDRHHFSRTTLHGTNDRFGNRWVSETDEGWLDDRRGELAA